MKKILCALALSFCGIATSLSAQEASYMEMPSQPRVYQSLSFGTNGLIYKAEAILAPEVSVALYGGLGIDLGYHYSKNTVIINGNKTSSSNSEFLFAMRPTVGVSGTYYYNLRSRAQRGLDVSYQASNYFRVGAEYDFKPFFQTPKHYYETSSMSAYGLWGMRRRLSSKLISDFSVGLVYTTYKYAGETLSNWSPSVGFGVSYIL